jgi:hypothetical protein
MLHSITLDNFSWRFDEIRSFADHANYEDVTNPVDGVVYPGICRDVPEFDILNRLRRLRFLGPIENPTMFMRLSTEGTTPPHWAHSDESMGRYSLMLYLNRAEHAKGGTALLRHRDGEPDIEVWARDTNLPEQWEILSVCEMRPNRAFIFRSELWHAALPIGGFGKDATNGRLVLTVFFS